MYPRTRQFLLLVSAAAVAVSCGDPNPLYCEQASDCRDPARPFCDVNGVHPASNGLGKTCIPDPLILMVAVQGDGTVSSFPSGIDCPGACEKSYADGTTVTLTATATAGSQFAGWSGECTGTADCTVVVDGPKNVTATFRTLRTLEVVFGGNSGAGRVVSAPAGVDCPGTCMFAFAEGTEITLAQTEDSGATFISWSEPSCPGYGDCVFTLSGAKTVTAIFDIAGAWIRDRLASTQAQGIDVAYDSAGNLFVVGFFSGSINFGNGALTSTGSDDWFVAKFSATGSPLWLKIFGSTQSDWISGVAVNAANDVIVVGGIGGTAVFGTATYSGPTVVVAKLSGSSGAVVWSRRLNPLSGAAVTAAGVAIDGDNLVAIVGRFQGSLELGPLIIASNSGSDDAFVYWISDTGVDVAARAFGGTGFDRATTVAPTTGSRFVVGGVFSGTVDFNGSSSGGVVTSAGGTDGFVAEVGPAPNDLSWIASFGNANNDGAQGVAVDPAGNVWVAGGVDLGLHLVKYSSTGNELWSNFFGGARPSGLSVGSRGNVSVSGYFQGAVSLGGATLVAGGLFDGFVANFDNLGEHRWSRGIGSGRDFSFPTDSANGVAVSTTGTVATTGVVWGDVDFGGGIRTGGAPHVFVAIYGP